MRFKDSLLGFAIGDAVGVPAEFKGREALKNNPILDMEEYGTHYQPIGTWSDDTSMTIATIDSIIKKQGIDYNDIMNNFNLWVKEAKYTATDKCFDVGNTCRCAIYNFNGNNALECGRNEITANGNGSLMRILPIVYYCYYYKMSDLEIYDYIKKISSLTHAHEISVLGCYIYTKYIINLLDDFDKFESYRLLSTCDYSMFNNESLCVYDRILKKEIHKYKLKEIKSSGYIVDTLEAVLWTILNTKNYKDSILTAVNMGDDTDTVGAITGSIAGIIYGIDNIPRNWKENLKKRDYLMALADNYEKVLRMNERQNMNSEIKEKMKNIDGNIIVNGDIQSGKTTNLIFNTIESIIDRNESLLIVDSKEEYLNNYFTKLEDKEYNIIILNLRDLDKSVGWNPLEYPYSLYKNGNKDKAIEEIQNIGNAIFREEVGADPFWCKTSADFFTGITLGLFEDGKKEEINFNSINGMFNGMDSKYGLEDYTTHYFKLKGETSSAYNFASSTFLAPKETKGSILSVARQKLRLLVSREKLSILLSNTTFDMKEIVNKPTALFVINKDENTYINLVATLFIEQVYNYLFDIKEKNRFNFILDNFDSLSNFNDLASMIGAGISRNMRFVIGTRYKEKLLSTFGDYILKLATNIDVKSNSIEITRNGEKNSYSYEPIYVNISNNDITYPTLNINQINTFDIIKYVQEKKGECLFDNIDNIKLPIPPISNDLPPVPNVDELIKSIDKKIDELTLEEETEKLFNNNDDYFKSDLEQFKTE